MKLIITFLALLFQSISAAHSAPIELRRGISIHEWLNWSPVDKNGAMTAAADRDIGPEPASRDYLWPPYSRTPPPITAADLRAIRDQGFDFVRLSIDPGPLLSNKGQRRSEALAILGDAAKLVVASGLKVVFDYHPVGQVPAYSPKALEVAADQAAAVNYRGMVAETASMLRSLVPDAPSVLALELMNEPQFYPCDGEGGRKWQIYLEGLVKSVSEVAPGLTVIVSGACGGGIKGLMNINPGRLAASNLLYSFHFYENHTFTHQGGKAKPWLTSVPWPPSQRSLEQSVALCLRRIEARADLSAMQRAGAEREIRDQLAKYYAEDKGQVTIQAAFDKLIGWSRANAIPANRLFMGEFGVSAGTDRRAGADPGDRLRWLSFVRQQAEKHGIGWAYWEYNNPYGMSLTTDTRLRQFDPIAVEALGLDSAHPPGQW